MKTTLDLPDDLMRAVKVRAAQSNRRLKDLLAELITLGMSSPAPGARRVTVPRPAKLKSGPLTIDDIEAAIADGRD